ncbi:MAG: DUF5683 domain-containing protein [Bacteroidales bacterium]|nr:DUF5683 domain-containing protein [Bacteroidales bacterium]
MSFFKKIFFLFLVISLQSSFVFAQEDQSLENQKTDSSELRVAIGDDNFVPVEESEILEDTLGPITKNPKLAGWLSFAIPGAGQIYNGQYWKVPIIYGAVGTLLYVANFYNIRYKQMVNDEHYYLYSIGKDPKWSGVCLHNIQKETDIVNYMRKYRRYRDLCYVTCMLVYVLNIFDAVVDAHLYDFDISDDLTLKIEPYSDINFVDFKNKPAFGARLVFNF